MTETTKEVLKKIGAVLLALLIWQIAAMRIKMNILLVTPLAVLKRLCTIWTEAEFFPSVWFSFTHIAAGFLLALLAAVLFAFLAKKTTLAETLLWPFVVSVKAVPVASIVVLALVWLSARNLSVLISFLVVFPVVYQNLLTGLKNEDKEMEEMCLVYGMSPKNKLFYVTLPRLKPYLYTACSLTCPMAWKAGVAAEIIGTPAGSIGKQIYLAKISLDTDDMFAWTLVIVIVSVLAEKLFLKILKRGLQVGHSNQ